MTISVDNLLEYTEEHMMKTVEHMQSDFNAVRTGKASPGLIENISVDYYGTPTRLKEIAGITAPEPRLLVVQPWDPTSITAIEKAIQLSNIGISPVSDGRILRLPIPELSEERRKSLTKQVKTRAEEARIATRNIRRDSNEFAKKAQKDSKMTEDELKSNLEEIQKLTDQHVAKIDLLVTTKEADLLKV